MCEETRQSRKRVINRISTVFQTFNTMVTKAWQQQLLIGPKVSESGMVEGLKEVPVGAHSQVSPPGTTVGLSYSPQRSASCPIGIHFCPSWPVRQRYCNLPEQQSGNQMFKCRSLWGTFLTQIEQEWTVAGTCTGQKKCLLFPARWKKLRIHTALAKTHRKVLTRYGG